MLKARLSDRPPAKKIKNNQKKTKKINYSKLNISSLKKSIFYIFLSIFILLVTLSFLAPMFVNLKLWKPEIISIIEEYTGKKAVINGDINFSLYPYPQIITEQIIIYDDIDNNQQFFSSDIIKAKVSFWPLVTGNIEIDKIIIENVNLNLVNNKDTDPNWLFNNSKDIDTSDGITYMSENFSLPKIQIKQYEFIGGKVTILNNTSVYNLDLSNILLDSNSEFKSISGNILFNNINFSINGNFDFTKNLYNLSLSIFNNDLKVFIDGNGLYENNYPSYSGELKIDIKDTKDLSVNFGGEFLRLLNEKTKFESKLELEFSNKDLIYSLDNINISSGLATLTGAISGNSGLDSRIDIVLSSNNFNLDGLYENINNYLEIIDIDNDENTNINSRKKSLNINGSLLFSVGTSKLLDYPVRDILIDIKKNKDKYILQNAQAIFPGNTEINFKGEFVDNFKVFNGNTNLTSENIKSFGNWLSFDFGNLSETRFKKTNISSSIVFRKGGATFAGLTGEIDTSKISGELRLRFSEKNNLSANLKIDQINIDAYIDSQNNKDASNKEHSFIDNFYEVVLDLQIDKAVYEGDSIEGINFSAAFSDKNLNLRKLEIKNYKKGDLFVQGDINFLNKKTQYDLSFSYENDDFSKFTNTLNNQDFIKKILFDKGVLEVKVTGEAESLNSQIKFINENIEMNYVGNTKYISFDEIIWDGEINGKIKNLKQFIQIPNEEIFNYKALVYLDKENLKFDEINIKSNDNFYEGEFEITLLETPKINSDIYTSYLTVESFKGFNNFISDNFSSEFIGKFKIKSDSMLFLNNTLNNFSGIIEINRDKIIFKSFRGEIFNTKISKSGSYDKINNILNTEIKISKGDINLLFDNYFNNNALFGKFSSKFKFIGKGKSFNEIANNLQGNGQVKLRNIYIESIDLINSLNFLQSIKSLKDFESSIKASFQTGNNSKIDNMEFELIFDNNQFRINDMTVGIEGYYGYLNAYYDFTNNKLDGSLLFPETTSIKNEYLLNLNSIDDIASFSIDFPKNIEKTEAINSLVVDNNSTNIILPSDDIDSSIGFEEVLNDLSSDTIEEDNLISDNKNIDSELDINMPDNSLYNIETIKFSGNKINYNKVADKIINNIKKPKLPTTEEMLSDMLETLLGDE